MVFGPKRRRPPDLEIATLTGVLKDRLRAVVICLSHSWGGLEQVAAHDSLELGKLGLNIRVMCLKGTPIHEFLVGKKEVLLDSIDFRPRDFLDFKLRLELLRMLDAEKVNLIHCHQPSLLGSISPWLWNRRDVVLLASRHILSNHNKKNLFHAAIYRRLDALIVMSERLRENVLATHTLKERQIKMIRLGLDFEIFNPEKVDPSKQRALWGADASTIVIGQVGRIDPAKGQATFIKAAAGLMKNIKPNEKLRFVIVGEETLGGTSQYLAELRNIVSQFHLEEYFVFAGYQENIPEIMRSFDILVMPSHQEAFGLVSIEAMAMGCPIVISSGGSAEEIVGQEEFGLLMTPNDAFDLTRQLRALLDNPKERVRMGKRAREHVKKNYDRQVRVQKTLELYERTLRRRGL